MSKELNLGLGELLKEAKKKADKEAGETKVTAEGIREAMRSIAGEGSEQYVPTGQLITSGEAFSNTELKLKEALDSGMDSKGSVLAAIVGRDIIVTDSGDKALVGHLMVLANTHSDTVALRNQMGENHLTLAQVESLKQALDIAKEKLLQLKPSLSN